MKKEVYLGVWITQKTSDDLTSLSIRRKETKSEIVRELLDEGLANNLNSGVTETAYDSVEIDIENKEKKGWIKRILNL